VHAIVLVQSDNPATYSAVLGQLLEPGRGVTKITWAFLESDVNKAMVPTASTKLSEESYQRVNDIRDLDSLLRSTSILDVSGVPKDTLLQVFALTAGRRNVHLWTLSRTKANITVYVPLTSNPMIAAFRRSVWTLVATALLGVLSLVLALLGGYDSSSPFITWLSLFVGVVSFVLGASLTPIRGKRSTSEA
jgi:hypothetical protein